MTSGSFLLRFAKIFEQNYSITPGSCKQSNVSCSVGESKVPLISKCIGVRFITL